MKQVTFDEKDIKRLIRVDSKFDRFWRLFWRTVRQAVYFVILFFIFFLALNYSAYYQRFHYSLASQPIKKVALNPPPPPIAVPLPNYPPSISIPKIGVTAPMILNVGNDIYLDRLTQGVIQFAQTALPGQIGNMVVVGHSSNFPWIHSDYNTVFALVDKLAVGDQIIVPYQSQQYIYEVTGHQIVSPNDLAVLKKTDTPTLTLLTCYPVGTTRSRYIVLAKLISGQISGTQASEPPVSQLPVTR